MKLNPLGNVGKYKLRKKEDKRTRSGWLKWSFACHFISLCHTFENIPIEYGSFFCFLFLFSFLVCVLNHPNLLIMNAIFNHDTTQIEQIKEWIEHSKIYMIRQCAYNIVQREQLIIVSEKFELNLCGFHFLTLLKVRMTSVRL